MGDGWELGGIWVIQKTKFEGDYFRFEFTIFTIFFLSFKTPKYSDVSFLHYSHSACLLWTEQSIRF